MFLSLLLFLLVTLGALVYVAYLVEFMLSRRPGRVIYHGSNLREQGPVLVELIKKYVPNPEKYVLVEPGAGLAKPAEYLARRFTWQEVQAVELGPVILTLGEIRAWLRQAPLRFIHANIFQYDMPKPAVVYCYLTSDLLDELYKQGKLKECLVISLTFPLTGVEPTETVSLKSWQRRLLVYDFRR